MDSIITIIVIIILMKYFLYKSDNYIYFLVNELFKKKHFLCMELKSFYLNKKIKASFYK